VLLEGLRELSKFDGVGETIVAAHGETPETRRRAQSCAQVRWLDCPEASRGIQLNRGAAAAQGDILLLLHADSRLPRDGDRHIASGLSTPGVVGGAFRLGFDARHPVLDALSALSAIPWRTAIFGDQAMFCTRTAFESVGGFRPEPLFEDVDLALALARHGRLVRLKQVVTT
jgi:hypothetical protein